jgi:hypothetical protein
VLQVKTGHGLFPKKFIEDAPGGIWIVLEAIHDGAPLTAIGYRYSTRTTLLFVATKDAGTTRKGKPYQMKFTDDWGNVHIRDIDRPDIISKFFESSNSIDKHNQCCQSELSLEKRWQTQNPLFRLYTTIIGMNVVDCYLLVDHHKLINHRIPDKEYKMTMITFAGILAHQLICNVNSLLSLYSPMSQELRSLLADSSTAPNTVSILTPESTSTISEGDRVIVSPRLLKDANQEDHHQVAFDKTTGSKGKKRTKTRPCIRCLKQDK